MTKGAGDEDLAVGGDADFGARDRLARAVELDLAPGPSWCSPPARSRSGRSPWRMERPRAVSFSPVSGASAPPPETKAMSRPPKRGPHRRAHPRLQTSVPRALPEGASAFRCPPSASHRLREEEAAAAPPPRPPLAPCAAGAGRRSAARPGPRSGGIRRRRGGALRAGRCSRSRRRLRSGAAARRCARRCATSAGRRASAGASPPWTSATRAAAAPRVGEEVGVGEHHPRAALGKFRRCSRCRRARLRLAERGGGRPRL